jgi:hypothetical protein
MDAEKATPDLAEEEVTAPVTPEPAPAEETEAAPAETPSEETPSATAAPKLSAFERGKLRALGMGDLITRLEISEGQLSAAHGKIQVLEAENARLSAGREAAENAAREKIEAAEKDRETAVSKGVREKLSALGVPEEEAPSASRTEETVKELSRAEFEQLSHEARNEFIRQNGKIV